VLKRSEMLPTGKDIFISQRGQGKKTWPIKRGLKGDSIEGGKKKNSRPKMLLKGPTQTDYGEEICDLEESVKKRGEHDAVTVTK